MERANQKLRELEDIRAQFTLLTTHELPRASRRDPELPEADPRRLCTGEQDSRTLEKAERRAMDQLALIADLFELGRIGSAIRAARCSRCSSTKCCATRRSCSSQERTSATSPIDLQIAPDLPPVLANPDQIKSLWNNLISNAIKYNRDGGRVEIELDHEGRRLVARVSDTGIGIPPEAMKRLFSEFFRADNAKAHSRAGTGLGLSIIKEIVERAGGEITVESALDQGTTFRFWLPAITPQGKPDPTGDEEATLAQPAIAPTPPTG